MNEFVKKDFPGWGDAERQFVDIFRKKLVGAFGQAEIDKLTQEALIEAGVRKAPCDNYCDPISHIVGCPPPTVAK